LTELIIGGKEEAKTREGKKKVHCCVPGGQTEAHQKKIGVRNVNKEDKTPN